MTITDKTRKILWGKSASRCAICRHKLVIDATQQDSEALIGEECHIVAREINGPRGQADLPLHQRDEYDNLILLCRNHHKEVDDQLGTFTIEYLKNLKLTHEKWVQDSLDKKNRRNPSIIYAYRVDTGKQCISVIHCQAHHLDHDQLETEEESLLVGEFLQNIVDYSNAWNDISFNEKTKAQIMFNDSVKELNIHGLIVYFGEGFGSFTFPHVPNIKEPVKYLVGYVIIYRCDNPLVARKDEEIENRMKVPDQKESKFTNFVPVMIRTNEVRFE